MANEVRTKILQPESADETRIPSIASTAETHNVERNGSLGNAAADLDSTGNASKGPQDDDMETQTRPEQPVVEKNEIQSGISSGGSESGAPCILESGTGQEGAQGELGLQGGLGFVENGFEGDEAVASGTKAPASIMKSEFLTPAKVRVPVRSGAVAGKESGTGLRDEMMGDVVVPEKKSKRQLKRERQQAKKSTEGLCSMVARTGDVSRCQYGDNCLFNHDMQGYLEQKPPDLLGMCPSVDKGVPCSYGMACRYLGTHNDGDKGAQLPDGKPTGAADERNTLSKERQRLLWKNEGSYPKSEAILQAMGLLNKAYKVKKVKESDLDVTVLKRAEEELATTGNTEDPALGSEERPELSGSKAVARANLIRGGEHEGTSADDNKTEGAHGSQKRLRTDPSKADADPLEDQRSNRTDSHDGHAEALGDISNNLQGSKSEASGPNLSSSADATAGDSNGLCSREKRQEDLYNESKLGRREKKLIDFRDKLYLAPLTTVGNLPYRRVCKSLGADITCGEMAMCINLLQGQASEWALLRRHSSEDLFGVQICGAFPDHVARTAEMIEQDCDVDFIDVNMGCPIDLVVNKGAGSCLLTKPQRLEQLVRATAAVMENPLTIKVRVGYYEGRNCAHTLVPNLDAWGVNAVTIHGRTRQQRYSKMADWAYVQQCANSAKGNLQVIGNGDVLSYTDWNEHLKSSGSKVSTCMIARGALVKPWLFREIKEERHWDISSSERLDILRQYVQFGLEHWGSDSKGVETTRHFLLEWLSYMHRYVPVGLLEVVPQRLNWRPPSYFGRNDLETMMSSDNATDWVKITELLLGPPPANFPFTPKHKSNAYDKPENG